MEKSDKVNFLKDDEGMFLRPCKANRYDGLPTPSPATKSLPQLMRCTSTPISVSAKELSELLDLEYGGEAHLTFGGNSSTSSEQENSPHISKQSPSERLEAQEKGTRKKFFRAKSMLNITFDADDELVDSGFHTLSTASTGSLDATVPLQDKSVVSAQQERSLEYQTHVEIHKSPKKVTVPKLKTRTSPRTKSHCQKKRTDQNFVAYISRRRISYKSGYFIVKEHVDVMKFLIDMNMSHIISHIFSHLSSKDLCQVTMVSSTWYAALLLDTAAQKRRQDYLTFCKLNQENLQRDYREHHGTPRKALGNRTNVYKSPTQTKRRQDSRPQYTPTKFRHRLFREEAEKLSPGEELRQCPRCSSPSVVSKKECIGRCSRLSCGFHYCLNCTCEVHQGRDCLSHSTSTRKSKGLVGSKQSKSRLKRL